MRGFRTCGGEREIPAVGIDEGCLGIADAAPSKLAVADDEGKPVLAGKE